MARWCRQSLSVAGPFVCRCLTSSALLRFHIPLIELDVRISRIQLSDKESCLRPRKVVSPLAQLHQAQGLVHVLFGEASFPSASDLVFAAQPLT